MRKLYAYLNGENCLWIGENTESPNRPSLSAGFNTSKFKELGQRAMGWLYCSWDDSVKNAYSRYSAFLDKFKSGECARESRKAKCDICSKWHTFRCVCTHNPRLSRNGM